jgi:hypothetical protein
MSSGTIALRRVSTALNSFELFNITRDEGTGSRGIRATKKLESVEPTDRTTGGKLRECSHDRLSWAQTADSAHALAFPRWETSSIKSRRTKPQRLKAMGLLEIL